MVRRVLILVILLANLLGRTASAADPGDAVLFRGTVGAPEINEPLIKEGGVRVLTEASAVSERPPAFLATTENIVLSGEQVIDQPPQVDEEDTPTFTNNSRILVWRQIDPTENGLYLSGVGVWTRTTDADTAAELVNHFSVYIQSGVVYGQTVFRLSTTGPITLGTTPITFEPMPRPIVVTLAQLPVNPTAGAQYVVSEQDGTCQAPGDITQPCWWDAVGSVWRPLGTGATTLNQACAAGAACAFTDLPPERPLIIAPEGIGSVQVRFYGESGSLVDECVDGAGNPCAPSYQRLYPGQDRCLIMAMLDDPITEVCLESVENIDGITLVWSDRGPFANRPTDPYVDQTYLVNDCLNASCTAGGGTTRVWQQWTGSAWANLTGTAAAGDIEAVWGCSSGPCSALVASSGDTFDTGSATSSKPTTRSTASIATSCTEGQLHQDTDSGGSELYYCTTTNAAVKLQAVLPWEIPFSAAGLVVDATNCVQQTATQIGSGPFTRPVICNDAPGTLELSFLSPARWDGTPLTVSFVVADTTTSGHVWSANVEGQCRTPGSDAISSTWGTAVAATVTMTTANVPYVASSTITPNTACAGGDWVAIRATINSATTHTDASARILGGKISGSQL